MGFLTNRKLQIHNSVIRRHSIIVMKKYPQGKRQNHSVTPQKGCSENNRIISLGVLYEGQFDYLLYLSSLFHRFKIFDIF